MPQATYMPAARPTARQERPRWWCLLVIALGELLMVMDVTVVNVALPSIQQALHVPAGDRQWVITAYILAFAGLLPAGRVAGRIGHKRAFLIALAGFAAASAMGGASASLPMLVAARAAQVPSGRCWPRLPWRWLRSRSPTRASGAGRSACSAR